MVRFALDLPGQGHYRAMVWTGVDFQVPTESGCARLHNFQAEMLIALADGLIHIISPAIVLHGDPDGIFCFLPTHLDMTGVGVFLRVQNGFLKDGDPLFILIWRKEKWFWY